MSGPFARIIAQALVAGFSVVSRAFVQAYTQAAAQAKTGAKQGAKAAASSSASVFRNQISESEALKILNFTEKAPPKTVEEVLQRYEKYFNANDPKRGGSFYLQSKVYRAKEKLESNFPKSNNTSPSDTEVPKS